MFVFWIIAKPAVFPVIVVSKNKRYPEFILYGLGDVMCRGHDGHIESRPGSSVRGHAGFGAVVRSSEPVVHEPLGAGSSVLSSKGFSAAAGTAACTDSHRQHVCGFVH